MFAGMAHAEGDYVYALDCDLEEDPENLAAMYRKIKAEPDVDVVYGVLSRQAQERIQHMLEVVGLTDRAGSAIKEFSRRPLDTDIWGRVGQHTTYLAGGYATVTPLVPICEAPHVDLPGLSDEDLSELATVG